MNKSLIRKFCESPQRKLIVVIATTTIGLFVWVPLVDEYFDVKASYATLTDELGLARQTAKTLPSLEEQLVQLAEQLEELEKRAVTEGTLSRYRSQLVEHIRGADCRVRKLDVSPPTRRPWVKDDDPLQQTLAKGPTVQKTPFILEKRTVSFLVDGTMENIQNLLEQLHKDKTFAHLNRMSLHTKGRDGGVVTLEIDMWLFALERQKRS